MKTAISIILHGLVATTAAYPAPRSLGTRSCTPGALVCNGKTQFQLCNGWSDSVWMAVSAGTECICSGSDCKIEAVSDNSDDVPISSFIAASTAANTQPPSPTQSNTVPFVNNPQHGSGLASSSVSSINIKPSSTTAPESQSSAEPAAPSKAAPLPTASSAPPPAASSASPGSSAGGSKSYIQVYSGDGSNWPTQSSWLDFESMWSANQNILKTGCTNWAQENNSDQEIADMKSAIQSVSKSSGVDARFIFAIVMQESNGCVRVPTTANSVPNPGLMQDHDGPHSCFNVNPCPADQITGMIRDGTEGTAAGDGLKQLLQQQPGSDSSAEKFYRAARAYNSGSIAASGILEDGIATHCYSTDVANRLLGWSQGPTACHLV